MAIFKSREVPVEIIFDHEAFAEIVAKCDQVIAEAKSAVAILANERSRMDQTVKELKKVADRLEKQKKAGPRITNHPR